MLAPIHGLQAYLEGLRAQSGAARASLFVPAADAHDSRPILLHDGDGADVPELADVDTAQRFARAAATYGAEGSVGPPLALQMASVDRHARLLRIPSLAALLVSFGSPRSAGKRRTDRQAVGELFAAEAWLGLRFERRTAAFPFGEEPLALPPRCADSEAWGWLLALGSSLVWHERFVTELLVDAVTGLPGRKEFITLTERVVDHDRAAALPTTLALCNPDGFVTVNQAWGREAGDAILAEIAAELRNLHRASDVVARYGGAIFAVALGGTPLASGLEVEQHVRAELEARRWGAPGVELTFSIGLAAIPPDAVDLGVEDLLTDADRALARAKAQGGRRCVAREGRGATADADGHDPLGGVFTADPLVDYRNMTLLLQTLQSTARAEEPGELAASVLRHVDAAFEPARIALLRFRGEALEVTGALERTVAGAVAVTMRLDSLHERLARDATRRGAPVLATTTRGDEESACCAVPIRSGDEGLGCLWVERMSRAGSWQRHDVELLALLGAQLGLALQRAEQLEQERARRSAECRRLQSEVDNLQRTVAHHQLVFRSSEMERLMRDLQRVAPTDANVLIIGESGTGKEIVGRMIHDLSPRRSGPCVVLDCAAVPDSLVESELFGHERGAFTGADRKQPGRFLEADGGTLILDEVGELPLPVQAKFLRLVQERQFTAVGSTRLQSANVRIVALTNRDLAREAAAGRFREDLFHRLNVIRLDVPPLRRRRSDVLLLAEHFALLFGGLYGKRIAGIAEDAVRKLQAYPWPGNVRELRNSIQRAVILGQSERIGAGELSFDESPEGEGRPEAAERAAEPHSDPAAWGELTGALEHAVPAAAAAGPLPLGDWVHHELIVAAYERTGGVGRQAAELLGMPETSLRRRLDRAREWERHAEAQRFAAWAVVRAALHRLLDTGNPAGVDLLAAAERLLVEILQRRLHGETGVGAAVLGVSLPTYRRRLLGLRDGDGQGLRLGALELAG